MKKLKKPGPNLGTAIAEFRGELLDVDFSTQIIEQELAFKKEPPKSQFFDKFSRPSTAHRGKNQKTASKYATTMDGSTTVQLKDNSKVN